ncbi:uncharacterized protein VTP21DRAFT_5257 [Calcarisporiella thermophila]|uniref:uncharacterized protein n=1 Tax=Calcarisporiella thermophila TaxID=911321 RepID=UPI0037445599
MKLLISSSHYLGTLEFCLCRLVLVLISITSKISLRMTKPPNSREKENMLPQIHSIDGAYWYCRDKRANRPGLNHRSYAGLHRRTAAVAV